MKLVTEIKVVESPNLEWRLSEKLQHASVMKFTYLDMVHFFGNPKIYEDVSHHNRRVEWAIGEFDLKGKIKTDDNGDPLIAYMYDSDLTIPVEDNFLWDIDSYVCKGFENITALIIQQRVAGKKFVSKSLPKDIAEVSMTPDQKKMMANLKIKNDEDNKNSKRNKSKDKSVN